MVYRKDIPKNTNMAPRILLYQGTTIDTITLHMNHNRQNQQEISMTLTFKIDMMSPKKGFKNFSQILD